MHIPDGMITGTICPVTTAVAAVGASAATYFAYREKNKPTALQFGAVSAFIFAAQMMNFAISKGTSGHFLGGVLAVALLGVPFGILAMTLVLILQCCVFADGGISVLGANVINMALVGAGAGGILVWARKQNSVIWSAVLAWFSVVCAAWACSIQLTLAGAAAYGTVTKAMLSTHALIGIGEAVITGAVVFAAHVTKVSSTRMSYAILIFAALIATCFSPFACGSPDGLEWVAHKYNFVNDQPAYIVGIFADYSVAVIRHEGFSTACAGFAGVIMTLLTGLGCARVLK